MRIARIVTAAGLLFMLLPPAPASAANRTVVIPGNYYNPPTIRIHPGDTVRWFNDTSSRHTVTSNSDSDETFNSTGSCGLLAGNDCIRPGRAYSHTFDQRGTFTYHCRIHGSNAPFPNCGMCGRVVVVRQSSSTVQPTTAEPTPTGTPTNVSPSPSPSSPTPTGSAVSPDSSPQAAGPGGDGNTPVLAIAAAGVVLLAGSGFLVYRTMIRR